MKYVLKNNLRRLRFEKERTSQEALAEAVDVSRQTINAIENGKFNPSVALALKISKFFNRNVEEIFYLEVKDET